MLVRDRNHLFNVSTDTRINFLKMWHLLKILQLLFNKNITENVNIFKRKKFITKLYSGHTETHLFRETLQNFLQASYKNTANIE